MRFKIHLKHVKKKKKSRAPIRVTISMFCRLAYNMRYRCVCSNQVRHPLNSYSKSCCMYIGFTSSSFRSLSLSLGNRACTAFLLFLFTQFYVKVSERVENHPIIIRYGCFTSRSYKSDQQCQSAL